MSSFLKAVKEDKMYSSPVIPDKYLQKTYVENALDTYISSCRKEYRAVVNPPSPAKVQKRKDQTGKTSRQDTVWIISPVLAYSH